MPAFDDLNAEIKAYPPVLTAGELIRIAERMGWRQDRKHGSHCILIYPQGGYNHISIKAPGRGAEQTRTTTRNHLNEIFKPALDQAEAEAAKTAALQTCISQLDELLEDCRSQFLAQAELTLQTLKTNADRYETQRLQECDQEIAQLLTERQRQHIAHVEAQAAQARQELARVQQNQQTLRQQAQAAEQIHHQLSHTQQQLEDLEAQLAMQETTIQQQNMELLTLRASLTQLRKRRQWRRMAELAAIVLLGFLLVTSLHPAIGLANLFNLPPRSSPSQ